MIKRFFFCVSHPISEQLLKCVIYEYTISTWISDRGLNGEVSHSQLMLTMFTSVIDQYWS